MQFDDARKILLDHARRPHNSGKLENFEAFGESKNPLCGDSVKIYLKFENGIVSATQLQVAGCTMCTATASLLSEAIKNKSKHEIEKLKTLFEDSLVGSNADWPRELEDFGALSHLRQNPARIPCALIPWVAVKNAILLK